jgi:hypothetical protein
MGGKGSGGARPGSGRKSKDADAKWLGGNAGKRDGQKPPKAPAPFELIAPLVGLTDAQIEVWNDLAPHACAQRTLTAQTARAFADLCEAIVLKRRLMASIEANGLTYLKVTIDGAGQEHTEQKANPLLAQHRGMMQRVEAALLRFRLSPIGKELAPAAASPKDEWAEFDETPSVN